MRLHEFFESAITAKTKDKQRCSDSCDSTKGTSRSSGSFSTRMFGSTASSACSGERKIKVLQTKQEKTTKTNKSAGVAEGVSRRTIKDKTAFATSTTRGKFAQSSEIAINDDQPAGHDVVLDRGSAFVGPSLKGREHKDETSDTIVEQCRRRVQQRRHQSLETRSEIALRFKKIDHIFDQQEDKVDPPNLESSVSNLTSLKNVLVNERIRKMMKCDAMARRGDGTRISKKVDAIETTSSSCRRSESTKPSLCDDPLPICTVFATPRPASLPCGEGKNGTRVRSDEDRSCQLEKQGKESMDDDTSPTIQNIEIVHDEKKALDMGKQTHRLDMNSRGSTTTTSSDRSETLTEEDSAGTELGCSSLQEVENLEWTIVSSYRQIGVYCGSTLNGKIPHGFGTLRFLNGDVYEGTFRYGVMHGVDGRYVSASGSRYKGEFRANWKCGSGEEIFQNGDRYVGHYDQGRPHGFGVKYAPCGEIVYYLGRWHRGKPVAKATARVTFADEIVTIEADATQRTCNSFESFEVETDVDLSRMSNSCEIAAVDKKTNDNLSTDNNCDSSDSVDRNRRLSIYDDANPLTIVRKSSRRSFAYKKFADFPVFPAVACDTDGFDGDNSESSTSSSSSFYDDDNVLLD